MQPLYMAFQHMLRVIITEQNKKKQEQLQGSRIYVLILT